MDITFKVDNRSFLLLLWENVDLWSFATLQGGNFIKTVEIAVELNQHLSDTVKLSSVSTAATVHTLSQHVM